MSKTKTATKKTHKKIKQKSGKKKKTIAVQKPSMKPTKATISDGKIHQYIMKTVRGQKQKVGVLVGTIDVFNVVRIGWSKTNINAGDKFNKKFGLELATARTKSMNGIVPVPPSIFENAVKFAGRCERYFKNQQGSFVIIEKC
jgi:hypothetical protein